MKDVTEISAQLEHAHSLVVRGVYSEALRILVDIRESGVVNKGLDTIISNLHDSQEIDGVTKWLDEAVGKARGGVDPFSATGEHDFEEWVNVPSSVSLSSVEEEILADLDDMHLDVSDDLLGMDIDLDLGLDLDSPPSIDFALVSNSEASLDEETREPDEKTRLRKSLSDRLKAGDFRLPKETTALRALEGDSTNAISDEPVTSASERPAPREVVSQHGAVDDFFAGILDEEDDPVTRDAPDAAAMMSEDPHSREMTPMQPVSAVQRSPNPFEDLASLGDDPSETPAVRRPGFDSGVSQVRYAGVAPPPPTHRLKGGVGGADSEFTLDPPEKEAEFEFDLGLSNPNEPQARPFEKAASVKPPEPEEDEFDFDLGLSAPGFERRKKDESEQTKPGDAKRTKPNLEENTRSRVEQPTPYGLTVGGGPSEPIDEDEFFSLAESFASESSAAESAQPYRGEPMIKGSGESTNPFTNEDPTGVKHVAVESSFVLEEVSQPSAASSHVMTNMAAIILEARRMYAQGDFQSALSICEKIMSRGPDKDAEELKNNIEGELERLQLEHIGSLQHVPTLSVDMGQLAAMDLDHRAGFLMSQIDGTMSYEDLLELSSMPRFETLEVLVRMIDEGAIESQ